MARFLNGPGVQASLIELIKNTHTELFIISPYLKISTMMKNYLGSVDSQNIPINIIYRSDFRINDDDNVFFNKLNNLKLFNCENLHTKCFMNENEGIISTMNLHEHSQTHNWEMGIRFTKQDDQQIFNDVAKELQAMGPSLQRANPVTQVAESRQKYRAAPSPKSASRTVYKPTTAPNKGLVTRILDTVTGEVAYCIRCGKPLAKFDMQKPYCDKCYASWAKYGNPKYKEKFCHACGSDKTKSAISFEKPTCKECFREYYK